MAKSAEEIAIENMMGEIGSTIPVAEGEEQVQSPEDNYVANEGIGADDTLTPVEGPGEEPVVAPVIVDTLERRIAALEAMLIDRNNQIAGTQQGTQQQIDPQYEEIEYPEDPFDAVAMNEYIDKKMRAGIASEETRKKNIQEQEWAEYRSQYADLIHTTFEGNTESDLFKTLTTDTEYNKVRGFGAAKDFAMNMASAMKAMNIGKTKTVVHGGNSPAPAVNVPSGGNIANKNLTPLSSLKARTPEERTFVGLLQSADDEVLKKHGVFRD